MPEVALTPQTVARLRSRLEAIAPGHRCVVWHSHLGEGERLDGWLALASGEVRVAVGARSAVFAPVRNLRLIVVDEEHEPAYKQDEVPRYHGRDVAVMRARLCAAQCVLGSATPSLESHANALAGRYGLLASPSGSTTGAFPPSRSSTCAIEAARQRAATALSRTLADAMQARFERREQTILFINRRGYSSSMQCRKCGAVEECPHCSISMTYHRTDETLRCHLCGEERPAPVRCAQCGAPDIRWRGLGTQRVEEAVRRVLPRARSSGWTRTRWDGRTASARSSGFPPREGRRPGGDPDDREGPGLPERDARRAGGRGPLDAHPGLQGQREDLPAPGPGRGPGGKGGPGGEVVVQSFTPQAEAIQFARHADFDGFAAAELEVRREFGYPPSRHLIRHLFRGTNPDKLKFFAEQWAKAVREGLGTRMELRGPAPAPIEKIRDEYRWQLWYFVRERHAGDRRPEQAQGRIQVAGRRLPNA